MWPAIGENRRLHRVSPGKSKEEELTLGHLRELLGVLCYNRCDDVIVLEGLHSMHVQL